MKHYYFSCFSHYQRRCAAPKVRSFHNVHQTQILFILTRRAINEEKDAKERDAKAARKAGGKAALKKLLSDRAGVVEARKAKNREDEAAKEKEAMDALEGESWGRVVSLINIHGAAAAAAAPEAGGKGKKAASSSGGSGSSGDGHDTSRHKDLLISLKSSPLPKQ